MDIKSIHHYFLKCNSVSIDTRKIEPGSLFVAIKGDIFDANTFAKEALEKGASFVIIDNPKYFIDDRTVVVEDSLNTLQELAKYHRDYLNIPIVALTGSNGKTTTKELIQVVLAKKFNTKATFGNLNNHIGVPLTLLSFTKDTEVGIVEMGANHQKEIEFLCEIAKPDFGYITNFGKAHLEGFGGVEGVIQGKSELYQFLAKNSGVCLINSADSKQVAGTLNQEIFSFGTSSSATVTIQDIDRGADENIVILAEETKIISQLKGTYNFTNIAAAVAFGNYFEIPIAKIKKGIAVGTEIPERQRYGNVGQWAQNQLTENGYNINSI